MKSNNSERESLEIIYEMWGVRVYGWSFMYHERLTHLMIFIETHNKPLKLWTDEHHHHSSQLTALSLSLCKDPCLHDRRSHVTADYHGDGLNNGCTGRLTVTQSKCGSDERWWIKSRRSGNPHTTEIYRHNDFYIVRTVLLSPNTKPIYTLVFKNINNLYKMNEKNW